jgi:transcription-repair coupling factor (superfamily II helicase)
MGGAASLSEAAARDLSELLPLAQRQQAVRELASALERQGGPAQLSVLDAARPFLLAALHLSLRRPLLVLVPRPVEARALVDELCCWHPRPGEILLFPEQDLLPHEARTPDQQATAERLATLTSLLGERASGAGGPAPESPRVVASLAAAAHVLVGPLRVKAGGLRLSVRGRVTREHQERRWLELGYEPVPVVDAPGQFSRRGGILDIYPLVGDPCRVELFGDELESLRTFDPLTQRSGGRLESLLVTPTSERGPSGDDAQAARSSLMEFLPAVGLLAVVEPGSLEMVAREHERQAEELRLLAGAAADSKSAGESKPDLLRWPELHALIAARAPRRLELIHDPERETLPVQHAPAFGGRLRDFLRECERQAAGGQRVIIVTQQAERLAELLETAPDDESDGGVDGRNGEQSTNRGAPILLRGQLSEGWASTALGLTLFTDAEIFGFHKVRRPGRVRRPTGRQSFLVELQPGDLVVHVDHGIARYRGMQTMASEAGGQRAEQYDPSNQREFLVLEYAEGDRLYVPAEQADRVSRYVGAGDSTPSITRLGSGEWNRARSRVRKAVREIAQELLELYATREAATGFAFPVDTIWQRELESSFPYVETPDQLRALEELKADMERPRPMDRLLVGDVGYGKTEVALRAAFKAVEAGKQVAVLVPTTVLAQQHWNTFRERLAAFPVSIEMLSRFRSDKEQREVLAGLKSGAVDICIGTHRLLQKDVAFKDLGLVVVDEEQRFGVSHKERLKRLRREVDVLTLSATPIPRTLHMSLVGVRDMSTIETPPEERQPIRTFVMEYDQGLVREAILRELERGGQVYYVHNRVQSIEIEARRLQELVPEARIAIGHGQMPEEQLERVMLKFADGDYDVLVCTTIIESGLDIPSVNTIIVNQAHRFGLAQLYQLRGRVGRSRQRAYAYLLYQRDLALTEVAEKRLRTIFEATELGAGFRIALKDLEIRGAGNLLGAEQSGHISAVGFDLYTRLLADAVRQLKAAHAVARGQQLEAGNQAKGFRALGVPSLLVGTSVNLPLSARLPASYISDDPTRLHLYQRLAAVTNGEQLTELVDELEDRFGPLPEEAQNLVYVVGLRLAGRQAGVTQIQSVDGEVVVQFAQLPRLDVVGLSRAVGVPLRAGSNQLRLARGTGSAWLVQLQKLVETLPKAS